MTITTQKFVSGYFPTGETSRTGAPGNNVVFREFNAAKPEAIPNTVSLDDLLTEFEQDPDMAARMATARQKLADHLYADETETLSYLRLHAGKSQAQLAQMVNTSQSHIARIETGQTDPSTDVVARIAAALGIDNARAFNAIRVQRQIREGQS